MAGVLVGRDFVLALNAAPTYDVEAPLIFDILDQAYPEVLGGPPPVKDACEVASLCVIEVATKD